MLARIVWDPRIVGGDVGTTPIFNWLLWGYGVPALSFWVGGISAAQARATTLASRSVDSAAITVHRADRALLEIRHLMNDGDIYRPAAQLGELGLQVSTGLAMTIGLEHVRVRSRQHHPRHRRADDRARCAFLAIVFGLGIRDNPMVTGEPVGGRFFNYVLLGYGIPAVLMAILARTIRETRPRAALHRSPRSPRSCWRSSI